MPEEAKESTIGYVKQAIGKWEAVATSDPQDRIELVYWIVKMASDISGSVQSWLKWNVEAYVEFDDTELRQLFRTLKSGALSLLDIDIDMTSKYLEKLHPGSSPKKRDMTYG
jgi:hypothetical protein